MKLIGGRDYYDNALFYGRDETITFVRRPSMFSDPEGLLDLEIPGHEPITSGRIEFARIDRTRDTRWRDTTEDGFYSPDRFFWTCPLVVYAAGRRYAGIEMIGISRNDHRQKYLENSLAQTRNFFYTFDEFDTFVKSYGYEIAESGHRWRYSKAPEIARPLQAVKDHFSRPIDDKTKRWMIEQRHSIVIVRTCFRDKDRYHRFRQASEIDSDGLHHIQFYRAVDPAQMMQELSMWLGGVLPRPGALTVEITDDKIKAAKHGMDKWSFRKMPQE